MSLCLQWCISITDVTTKYFSKCITNSFWKDLKDKGCMFSQAVNLTNTLFCYKILCVCVYLLHHSAEGWLCGQFTGCRQGCVVYSSVGGGGLKTNFHVCTLLPRGKAVVNQQRPACLQSWLFRFPSAAEESHTLLHLSCNNTDAVLESKWSFANRIQV